MAYLDESGLSRFWNHIMTKLGGKVDKEDGKGLSSNDFTTAEKEKLAGLNNITIDSTLDSESTNAIENKAVYEAINLPKSQILLKDSYQDTFVLVMKDNSLTSEKIPYQVDILPLEKSTFTTFETFTIDDCPEVEGNFYREGKVSMKDKTSFRLMIPPTYNTGYGINEDNNYSFLGKNAGEYKLVIEYPAPAIGFASTSQNYYIIVTEPQQTILFDDTFYYAPWEEEDGSFSTVPNITSYNPNKEYIIYTDTFGSEMVSYPATLYYDEYNNSYTFSTDYIYDDYNGCDTKLSIYYSANSNYAQASLDTENGEIYSSMSGRVQIAEIVKPVSEIFFQDDNLMVQGNGYVHFMDSFTIPENEIPENFTAIYELEVEGEKIKETSTFTYDSSTKTWKDNNGAEFDWISDNYSRLYLNAYLGSTISITFQTIV